MAIQSQPSRIPEPFAGSGTKNTIPATNATPSASQAASWASGFPPECSQPISAGGCPVPRNDVNGALNQLSQDFAFRQDGGIWGWSALADYDIQRMVRGADGLLYYSAAQSGPGFGAGAVDPTTDDGTYWKSPALKTMPLADKSTSGATTEWVKDIIVAPVYLDPSGLDTNDGLSSATAVKTFEKAIEICRTISGYNKVIVVSSGTYTGNLVTDNDNIKISLQGSVTINGRVNFNNMSVISCVSEAPGAVITILSDSIANPLLASRSFVYFDVDVVIKEKNCTGDGCIQSIYGSYFYLNKSATVISDTSAHKDGVLSSANSSLLVNGLLTINAENSGTFTYGVHVFDSSYAGIYGGIQEYNVMSSSAIAVTNGSSLFTDGNCVLYSGNVFAGIYLDNFSKLIVTGTGINFTMNYNGTGSVFVVYEKSYVIFNLNTASTLTVNSSKSSASDAFRMFWQSFLKIGNCNVVINGAYDTSHGTVWCAGLSYFYLDSSASVSGNATGKRYTSADLAIIAVGGGANRIPGTTAGSTSNGALYF